MLVHESSVGACARAQPFYYITSASDEAWIRLEERKNKAQASLIKEREAEFSRAARPWQRTWRNVKQLALDFDEHIDMLLSQAIPERRWFFAKLEAIIDSGHDDDDGDDDKDGGCTSEERGAGSHSRAEERARRRTLCFDFQKGCCSRGESCRFVHDSRDDVESVDRLRTALASARADNARKDDVIGRLKASLAAKLGKRPSNSDDKASHGNGDESMARLVAVLGRPGAGLSTLAAKLLRELDSSKARGHVAVLGGHFCLPGHAETLLPRRFVENFAAALVCSNRLYDKKRGKQQAQQQEETADILRCCDTAKSDPHAALGALLRVCARFEVAQQLVFVVDGLDEAARHTQPSIAELVLHNAPAAPSWLTFVVTSRSDGLDGGATDVGEDEAVRVFPGVAGVWLPKERVVDLDSEQEAKKDMQEYIRHRIEAAGMGHGNAADSEVVVEQLAAFSGTNLP